MEELTRKQKKSHDHRFTTWLKNIIFGIVMIAPFLSVMARTIYVQSNKNAKDSYYGETINQESNVIITDNNKILNNNVYYRNAITTTQGDTAICRYYISNIEIITNENTLITNETILQIAFINLTTFNNNTLTELYDAENTSLGSINSNTGNLLLKFYVNQINGTNLPRCQNFYVVEYNNYSYLDNVFEYSINQLHNVNVYNWAKNTAIYTAIDNMTSGLGMGENNTLALLLAYWSILTAVYIVFDIIIFCFTKITHFINSD